MTQREEQQGAVQLGLKLGSEKQEACSPAYPQRSCNRWLNMRLLAWPSREVALLG